jgi:hypothetical protein
METDNYYRCAFHAALRLPDGLWNPDVLCGFGSQAVPVAAGDGATGSERQQGALQKNTHYTTGKRGGGNE